MRGLFVGVLCFSLIGLFLSDSEARDERAGNVRVWRYWSPEQYASDLAALDPGLLGLYSSAAVDTYNIVMYDFESMDWQGWTQWDWTAQIDTFFHADDFEELGGGDYGRLVPIEGTKSIWCGARPGTDMYMCRWATAPGYGNNWNQHMETFPFVFGGVLHLSYHGVFDSEAGYDYTHVEYDNGDGTWVKIHSWDDVANTVVTHDIMIARALTKLRFHFTSDGAWSDEDGRRNTDGACIIDSITIWDDAGVIDFEDFESWEVGATGDEGSLWRCYPEEGYGIYSDLWANLTEKDFCNENFQTQIAFFHCGMGSWTWEGICDTPFCEGPGGISAPCQNEMVVSPVIDLTKYSTGKNELQDADIPETDLPQLGGTVLKCTMYGDMPLQNLVFATYYIRNINPTMCSGDWMKIYYPTYFSPAGYYFMEFDISDRVGSYPIQVALGVWDACEAFYAEPGDCLYHTPAPWYDNVRVQRYKMTGPQWSYRALDLFQDNFPENELNPESFVRADAADDKAPSSEPYLIPGDSVVVTCTSPMGGGIREGGMTGGGEVYLYVRVTDVWPGRPGGAKPPLYGLQLEGTYGTYVNDDGEWTKIQCPNVLVGGGYPLEDRYAVDLNDSLLTRGYMVEYYFEAFDVAGDRTTLPRYADGGQYFEFTCLPTGRSDVLFVDDFDGRGSWRGVVEDYWDATFEAVIDPDAQPDVYDVNSPSSMVGNGLASRARLSQLMYDEEDNTGYRGIIWDSGDLDVGTIGDGVYPEKANDCALLANWMDESTNDVGLLICGDGIAHDLSENLGTSQAIALMSTWCGVDYVADSYFEITGGEVAGGVLNPLITGASDGCFYHEGSPDQFYVAGGCPLIKDFDVLAAVNNGVEALLYPDYNSGTYAAGIQSAQENSALYTVRTMWLGFSWMSIRDDVFCVPIDRNELFVDIRSCLNMGISAGVVDAGGEVPRVYSLAQNCPNPFNPLTTIRFEIKSKGRVSLKIYNVAGQLVKTLVDEVLDAGPHSKEWKGLNDAGSKVASGVYFYRLEAGEYESVRKMVLLR